MATMFLFLAGQKAEAAFRQLQQLPFVSRRKYASHRLYSSIGDGPPTPPPDDNDDSGDDGISGWDDFLNPKEESENLRRARDFMSEQSLPITFDEDQENDDEIENYERNVKDMNENSSALVGPAGIPSPGGALIEGPSAEALANNPYLKVVSKLSPSELISKFTASANPRVQDAVRNTILGLIGSLPKMAFDTTTITTGQRLASLMFQLQMTGYMFKNADYRLSLSQSLGMENESGQLLLSGLDDDDDKEPVPVDGKVRGKLKLRLGNKSAVAGSEETKTKTANSTSGVEVEVDAAAYMSELRSEVKQLRDELMKTQQSKEEEIRKDLLLYIRTLPEQQLRSLTNTMSPDVLVAMKGLVAAVLEGIGDGQITADTVTEQSGEAMAQLCMWQLVVGYNLRELEVREEMKRNLLNGYKEKKDEEGGVDWSEPGTLE